MRELSLDCLFLQSCLRNFNKINLHPWSPKNQEDGFKNPPGFCLTFGRNRRRRRDIFRAAGSTVPGIMMMTKVMVAVMMSNCPSSQEIAPGKRWIFDANCEDPGNPGVLGRSSITIEYLIGEFSVRSIFKDPPVLHLPGKFLPF